MADPNSSQVEILVSASMVERSYKPRAFINLMQSACIGSVLVHDDAPVFLWLIWALQSFVWPHLAYLWGRKQANPVQAEEQIRLCEMGFAGFWLAAFHFQLMPSAAVVAVAVNHVVILGGWRLLYRCALPLLAGAGLGLLLTGLRFQPFASEAVQLGTLPMQVFYPAVLGWSGYQLLCRLNEQQEALRNLSERDALSGLNNRRYLEERLMREFEHYQRQKHDVTLIMIDVDDFKKVNDQYGHAVGDELIRQLGKLLHECARKTDVVARFGGDEFSILLPFTHASQSLDFVQRVRMAFQQLQSTDARMQLAGLSFGVAMPKPDMTHPDQWAEAADSALYRVKRSDRKGSVEIA